MTTRDSTIHPDIFKAYDVRGVYGGDLDLTEEAVYHIGRAAALCLNVPEIAVCRDMRVSLCQRSTCARFLENPRGPSRSTSTRVPSPGSGSS
jgi:Phosphoglucomutase/phosphomannomutase, alpha/beta/alpha domain I